MNGKMKYLRWVLLIVTIQTLIVSGCHSIRSNTSKNYPATLIFGQGGGVSGKYMEYSLVIDRSLYQNKIQSGERIFIKKISKHENRDFFIYAERLGLLKIDFNIPCNINYYIIYRKGVREKKVNWGNANKPPPEGVKELWERLWDLTK